MLTRKQRELLEFIRDYQKREEGISPTFQEMAAAVGSLSKGNIHRMLVKLEERGFIRRLKSRHRAIELLVKQPVMVPQPKPKLLGVPVIIRRDYACMPGTNLSSAQVLEHLAMTAELSEALYQMRRTGQPYTMKVTICLQEMGGQG